MNQDVRIIILVVAAVGIGLIVLAANPNYRISKNWVSNKDYYPGIGDYRNSGVSFIPDSASSSFEASSSDPDQEVLENDTLQYPKDIPVTFTDSSIEF
ncbi:MAG: hypothetical protein WBM02_07685 [bacterium]